MRKEHRNQKGRASTVEHMNYSSTSREQREQCQMSDLCTFWRRSRCMDVQSNWYKALGIWWTCLNKLSSWSMRRCMTDEVKMMLNWRRKLWKSADAPNRTYLKVYRRIRIWTLTHDVSWKISNLFEHLTKHMQRIKLIELSAFIRITIYSSLFKSKLISCFLKQCVELNSFVLTM